MTKKTAKLPVPPIPLVGTLVILSARPTRVIDLSEFDLSRRIARDRLVQEIIDAVRGDES